jgi:hypothetical protein
MSGVTIATTEQRPSDLSRAELLDELAMHLRRLFWLEDGLYLRDDETGETLFFPPDFHDDFDDEDLVDAETGTYVVSAVCEDGKVRPVRFGRSQIEELRRRVRPGDRSETFQLRAAAPFRSEILPALSPRVRQRGASREGRGSRSVRSGPRRARAPSRSGDPPDADPLNAAPPAEERAA